MKIRVIDRIILFLLALITLIAGVCAALNEFGISVLNYLPMDKIPEISANMIFGIRIAAIAVVILLSFYLFSVSFRKKRKPDPFINMESGSKGSIRMSMESISGLVHRTCKNIPGIQGLSVQTINHEDSVSVEMSFQVEISRNIPELSAEVQQLVGEVVERNCGVAVRSVCVTVNGFTEAAPQLDKPAKKSMFRREKATELPAAPAAPEMPVISEEPAPVVQEPVAVQIPAAKPEIVEEPVIEQPVVEEEAPVIAGESAEEIAEVSEPEETEEKEEPAPAAQEEMIETEVVEPKDDEEDEYLFTENE